MTIIPAIETLKQYDHWVCWKREMKQRRDGSLKPVKMPKNPRTGGNACSDKPETWASFDRAKTAHRIMQADGLGFFFTLGLGLVYVDLDDCVDEFEQISDRAREIVQQINSYTEISPSGRGLHIVAYGEIPRALKGDAVGVEMYQERRYLTATGRFLPDLPLTIQPAQAALNAIYEQYAPKREEKPARTFPTDTTPNYDLVREALRFIPPVMGYHDWVSICMAVHSAFPGDDGVALIEEWSPGFAGEVEEKFRSFRGSKTTLGTLFHHAKQHGFSSREAKVNMAVQYVSMARPEI